MFKLNINIFTRNILFVLIIVYSAQGALYPTGSIISQAALFILLAISGLFFVKTLLLKNNKNLFYNSWTALLLLNIFGFILTGDISNPLHFGMLKGILISLLTFYPFYYLSQKKILKSKHLIIFLLIVLPVAVLNFYFNQEQKLINRLSENTDIVNNAAYRFVNLIPFIFLLNKKKIISIVCILVIIFFIIQGAKRGAIITGFIGVSLYLYYFLKYGNYKNKIIKYSIGITVIIALGIISYSLLTNNEFVIERMTLLNEGGTSGRDYIYSSIVKAWYNSDNLVHIILGGGFANSLNLTGGSYAHNDWLELLSNFGLLGVTIYLLLFYSGYTLTKSNQIKDNIKILLITILIMWFLITLFSMAYTATGGYLRTILLGYLLGQIQFNNTERQHKLDENSFIH